MGNESFFQSKKAAAILKHAVLDQYVDPFSMKTGSTSPGKRVAFIDGYAGEGRYEGGEEGSPALLMRKAQAMAAKRKPVQDAFGRVETLRDLGYDARLPAAWIVFEESSAEQVVRDALIPLFFPRLGAVATVSARGASNLKVTVQDLVRLVLFVHLQGQEAADRTWILADGDEAGLDGLRAVGDVYPGIVSDHLVPLSEFGFEDYYPPDFEADVTAIRRIQDKRARKQAKGDLARRVTEWALADPDRAREQLQDSAAPVLAVLASIEMALASDR